MYSKMAFFKLSSCGPAVPVEQFSLKRGVKAFGHCKYKSISDKAHGAQYARLFHPVGEDDRGVLKTLGLEWWITSLFEVSCT